jgi:hypothetical protein
MDHSNLLGGRGTEMVSVADGIGRRPLFVCAFQLRTCHDSHLPLSQCSKVVVGRRRKRPGLQRGLHRIHRRMRPLLDCGRDVRQTELRLHIPAGHDSESGQQLQCGVGRHHQRNVRRGVVRAGIRPLLGCHSKADEHPERHCPASKPAVYGSKRGLGDRL